MGNESRLEGDDWFVVSEGLLDLRVDVKGGVSQLQGATVRPALENAVGDMSRSREGFQERHCRTATRKGMFFAILTTFRTCKSSSSPSVEVVVRGKGVTHLKRLQRVMTVPYCPLIAEGRWSPTRPRCASRLDPSCPLRHPHPLLRLDSRYPRASVPSHTQISALRKLLTLLGMMLQERLLHS